MKNNNKTNEQLLSEIGKLNDKIGKLEKANIEDEKTYKEAQALAHIGHWNYNVKKDNLFWSNELYSIFEIDNAKPLSIEGFLNRIHPDDSDKIRKQVEEGKSYRSDYRIVMDNGSIKYIHEDVKVIHQEDGKIVGMNGTAQDITKQKLVEQELRDKENLLSETQMVANLGSYVLDISSGNWVSSKILDDIFGINRKFKKDIAGWLQIIHKDDKDMMQNYFAINVLKNKEPFNKEYRIKKINNQRECWVHGLGKLELNDDGIPIKMIGTIQDITKRKQAEEMLRNSDAKHSSMIENIGDVIAIIGTDSMTKYQSPNVERWFGWKPEDLIGTNVWDKMHPEDIERVQKVFAKVLEEDTASTVEYRFRCKNGVYKWIEITGVNRFSDPAINGVLLNYHDITVRKQVEVELKRSKERLNIIFESAPDAYYLNDLKGTFIDGNKAAQDLLGYKREELIGKSFLKLKILPASEMLKVSKLLMKNVQGKGTGPDEFTLNRSDGNQIRVEISTYPVEIQGKTLVLGIAHDISERKLAEESLLEKTEMISAIVNTSKDWIWAIDLQGIHTYSNPAIESILGYPAHKLVGNSSFNLMHEDDQQMIATKLPLLISEKTGWKNLVIRWKHIDGRWRYLESNAVPIIEANGKILGFRGVDRDITARLQAEKKSFENEKKYKAVIDSSPDGIVVASLTGKILSINKAFEELTGFKSEDMVGKHFTKMPTLIRQDLGTYSKIFREALRGKKSGLFDFKWKNAKNEIRNGEAKLSLLKQESKITGMQAILRDNTEHKKAEEKLAENSEQRARLLKNARILSSSLDFQFILDNVTSQALELLESKGAAIYLLDDDKEYLKPVSAYDPPYESETLSNDINIKNSLSGKTVKSKRGMIFNNTSINPDAYQIPGTSMDEDEHLMVIPLLIEDEVIGTLNVYRRVKEFVQDDLELAETFTLLASTAIQNAQSHKELQTHREHLEELVDKRTTVLQEQNFELDDKRIEVEEANRLKSEFLSNMSHELRTPLNSIMSLSHVLSRQAKDKLSDEENSYLEVVERNGKKLLELINDILDLSKIEAGKVEIITDKTSLSQLLDTVKDSLTLLAEEKKIALNLKLPKNLPQIVTDETKLYQVFTNVVSNAVKFTEKGSVDIIVKNDTNNVIVDIKDTGIGISEKALPHIFDEFRQADGSTTRRYEGTGLGLAIAYKTIKLLGGTISVKSEFGKGSVFTVTIPIKWVGKIETNVKEIRPAVKTLKAKKGEVTFKTELPNVLIVEDNPDNMLSLKAILKDEYNIIEAYDGEEGLNRALEKRPHIIITDIELPKIDGIELVKILKNKEETKDIPVIVLTAHALIEIKELCIKAGCDEYIAKPFDQNILLDKMKKWL